MKKIIMGACALMALAVVSCDKCADSSCDATTSDSINIAYGNYVGSVLNLDYQRQIDMVEPENVDAKRAEVEKEKKEFLRGMQLVIGAEKTDATITGMQVGAQMLGEIKQLNENGAGIDVDKAFQEFKIAFLKENVTDQGAREGLMTLQGLLAKAREEAAAAKEAERANSPEALENAAAGKAFIENTAAADTAVVVLPSGLAYKIEEPGLEPKAGENATVKVHYTGRHIDGKEFQSTVGGTPATFNLQGVVPGFREGIMLLGKGGRATIYIPGDLAYGLNGQPAGGIGPNETLVFDIELLDIEE